MHNTDSAREEVREIDRRHRWGRDLAAQRAERKLELEVDPSGVFRFADLGDGDA